MPIPVRDLAFAKLKRRTLELYKNCDDMYRWSDVGELTEWIGHFPSLGGALAAVLEDGGKIISKKKALKRAKKYRR